MKRVLIVDGNRESFEVIAQLMSELGLSVHSSNDFESALHQLKAWKPHLILVDADSLKEGVFELVPKLRLLSQEEFVPIGVLSGNLTAGEVDLGSEVGVDDWLQKPISNLGALVRIKSLLKLKESQDALKRAHHRIDDVVSTDELTGLASMRSAYKKAEEEVARARRLKTGISAFLLNLDNFSDVNQNYGFGVGSYALQEVALRLKKCLRTVDIVARVGADEFFVLLHETDLAGAEFVAERVRDVVQSEPFRCQSAVFNLTATIGVAGLSAEQTIPRMSDLLHITMQALKSAKSNGQNRIEVYSFTQDTE